MLNDLKLPSVHTAGGSSLEMTHTSLVGSASEEAKRYRVEAHRSRWIFRFLPVVLYDHVTFVLYRHEWSVWKTFRKKEKT